MVKQQRTTYTVGNQFAVEIIAAQKTSFEGRLRTNTNEETSYFS